MARLKRRTDDAAPGIGADVGIGADGVPEGNADDRSGGDEHDPPGARGRELALVAHQNRLRRQEPDGQHRALALTLGQGADPLIEDRPQVEIGRHVVHVVRSAPQEADGELQGPADGLRRPRRDHVREVEEGSDPAGRIERPAAERDFSCVARQHASQALEERRLPRTVRPDDAEHFPAADREGHVVERGEPPEPLAQLTDVEPIGGRFPRTFHGERPLATLSACEPLLPAVVEPFEWNLAPVLLVSVLTRHKKGLP
jgi:hypothetical protein